MIKVVVEQVQTLKLAHAPGSPPRGEAAPQGCREPQRRSSPTIDAGTHPRDHVSVSFTQAAFFLKLTVYLAVLKATKAKKPKMGTTVSLAFKD